MRDGQSAGDSATPRDWHGKTIVNVTMTDDYAIKRLPYIKYKHSVRK